MDEQNLQPKEETLELLKRGEVRTMAKDIAMLREEEAKNEKARLLNEQARIEAQGAPVSPTGPLAPPLAPPMPPLRSSESEISKLSNETNIPLSERSSLTPKLLPRIIVLLCIAGILGVAGFFTYKRSIAKPAEQPTTKPPTQTTTPTPPEQPIVQEPNIAPPPQEIIQTPVIQEKAATRGFRIPKNARTIDTIIIDSTYNTAQGDVHDVEKVIKESQAYNVALHYLIGRDGAIYRLVPDQYIAYHAGTGIMPDGSRKNIINNFSLGIGLIYTTTESPNEEQYQSLAKLVTYLTQQYNIPLENILMHNQITPGKKDDPWNFDAEKFRSLLVRP